MWQDSYQFDVPGLLASLNVGQRQNTPDPTSLLRGLASLSGPQAQVSGRGSRSLASSVPDFAGMAIQDERARAGEQRQDARARAGEQRKTKQQEEEQKNIQAALSGLIQAKKEAGVDAFPSEDRVKVLSNFVPHNVAMKLSEWIGGEQAKREKSPPRHLITETGPEGGKTSRLVGEEELLKGVQTLSPQGEKPAKPMSTAEKWKQQIELMKLEETINDSYLADSPGMQAKIDFFNQHTQKPYIYQRTAGDPGKESNFIGFGGTDPTPPVNEKVDISTPEKIRDSNLPHETKLKLLKTRFGFE